MQVLAIKRDRNPLSINSFLGVSIGYVFVLLLLFVQDTQLTNNGNHEGSVHAHLNQSRSPWSSPGTWLCHNKRMNWSTNAQDLVQLSVTRHTTCVCRSPEAAGVTVSRSCRAVVLKVPQCWRKPVATLRNGLIDWFDYLLCDEFRRESRLTPYEVAN